MATSFDSPRKKSDTPKIDVPENYYEEHFMLGVG
jgi:hypothetical protein